MRRVNSAKDCTTDSFSRIVDRIKAIYKDKITDEEAETAARNMIGFCQAIVTYKTKKEREEQSKGGKELKNK